ncbi:YhdP family protein [Methylibium sp.]|uniref:YhdP family protein n=1 Tax=Methylibium sp. TaxID=2067992 RepID=UPI003D0F2884
MPSIPPPATASPPSPAAIPPRRRSGWARAGRWGLACVLLLSSIVIAAWLVLQWAILPRIEHWRPDMEMRVSHALGVPVRIGAIEVTDGGSAWRWAGAIELRDVVLYEAPREGAAPREALRLPSVRAALSPSSLLPGWDGHWRLRFNQLLVEGARLEVRRDARGRILVAGLEPSGQGDEGAATDWFFSQQELVIRGATLVWTDDLRGAPPLSLDAVDLVVRNGVRRHELRLDATPPAEWGERFSLRGHFTQPLLARSVEGQGGLLARPGNWRRWVGTLYADLPAADIAPLRRQVDLPFDLSRGAGALRAWVEVKNAEPVAATVDVALRDVALRLAAEAEPLAFERIDGRLSGRLPSVGQGGERSGELQARQFGFVTADGLRWPAADATLRWRLDERGAVAGGELNAQRLDLALLAQTLGRLPVGWIGADVHTRVASLAPTGVASQVEARWDGPLAAPQRYRLKASLRALGLAAEAAAPPGEGASAAAWRPGRPGLQGADIELTASESGGEASLALSDGVLEFPGVFEQPRIALQRLGSRLSWRIDAGSGSAPPRIEVRARELRFANDDAQGEFEATWHTGAVAPGEPGRFPGVLELNGRLSDAQATRVARYLPLGLSASVRQYLERAVQAGRASAVNFKVSGDLRHFPFGLPVRTGAKPDERAGEFRIAARLEGVRLAYMPGDPGWPGEPGTAAAASLRPPWPAFTDIKGELVFDRQSMELRDLRARLGTVGSGSFELSRVHGGIRNLADNATLVIEGNGNGPLTDALRYVNATPIGGWIGGALANASTGPVQAPIELQLALDIPLQHSERSSVRGSLRLNGNDLRLRPDLPLLANAKARVAFGESSFTLAGGSARVLGGEASFDGARQADGSLRFNVQGTASADGLRRTSELGPLAAQAGAVLGGQTAYKLALGVVHGQTEWQLSSNLLGLSVDLPAPLRKTADQLLPLRVQASLLPEAAAGSSGPMRDQLRVDLGPETARVVQAAWWRELGPDGARVLRGGIGVQDAMPQPGEGVAAHLNLPYLDLDAWQKVADTWSGAAGSGGGLAGAGSSTYAPATVALRAKELVTSGRHLHNVVVGLTRGAAVDEGMWRANLDATEFNGYAEYRPPVGARAATEGAGRFYARLSRLSLPKSDADAVSSLLEQASPASVPALDIVVDDFELRGKRLGRVEIEAQNREAEAGEAAREWRLSKFRLVTPDAELNASGRWSAAAPGASSRRRATMDFKLDVADGGALLSRLGQGELVRGAKGQLAGQVNWLGSPLAVDYASLGGQVRVAVEGGQFLQADPGMAKLLGVLSLQSLPRRLLLDFRDVFERGFVFDNITGDVSIAQGVASTRNLRMRGVQAVVLMEGSADIERETQDLRVWVVPEINAGAASLAVAAINPAVGLGSFVAQWLLRRPIMNAGTREFHVTGPWAEPKVERIERKLGDAVPTDEAASAPPPKETP